ncbi:MAG: hypothetical protein KOO61_02960 [Spirochaetales bacterium]|nr:hypothetical protein [Spirochaetales bacterium]
MKRILTVAMLLMIVSGFVLGEERRVIVPVNVSLFPFYGLGNAVTVVNNVQINVGVGYADELNGVALGVVSIIGDEVRGTQVGVVNLAGGEVFGAQVGVVNGSLEGVRGPQVGVVNLAAESSFQTGVVNAAAAASGVQIGVVNVAVTNTGAPIGLVSVVLEGGQTHAQSWIDETGLVNVGLIHGSRSTYNLYTAGTDVARERVSLGLGLGAHFGEDRSWVNVEALAGSVSRTDALFESAAPLFRARVYTGYRIGPLSLIGGVSFNYLMDLGDSDVEVNPLHGYEFGFSTERHRFWPGAFVGVQL